MRDWKLTCLALALAVPAVAADSAVIVSPETAECIDLAGTTVPSAPAITLRDAVDGRLLSSQPSNIDVDKLSAIDLKGRIRYDANLGPATGHAVPAVPSLGPKAVGDVEIHNPHSGTVTHRRRAYSTPTNPTSTATEYYANRHFTSQVARQLPFEVDSIWMWIDRYCSWSTSWQLSVVHENTTTPFQPDLTRVVSAPTVFSVASVGIDSAVPPNNYTTRGVAADCGRGIKQFEVDLPDGPYPNTAVFAVQDGTHEDLFDRPNEPLSTSLNWLECSATRCGVGALNVVGNRLTNAIAGNTVVALRLPDRALDPTARYLKDNVVDNQLFVHNPDPDVRLMVDYTTGTGTAGVFFRASRLFDLAGNMYLGNYYRVFVDGRDATVKLQSVNDVGVATTLASAPDPSAGSGTLQVDVSGFNPVQINVTINGTPVLGGGFPYSDATLRWQTDQLFGHLFGLEIPFGGGAEILDNFRVARNADLFSLVKFPPGLVAASDLYLWGDGSEEGREFFASFFTIDGTTWSQSSACASATCTDCTKVRGTLFSLQVRDPAAGNNLHQSNSPLHALNLGCCGCTTTVPWNCSVGPYLDTKDCDPSPTAVLLYPPINERVEYEIGVPIDMNPTFSNEHSPIRPSQCPVGATCVVNYLWIVCPDGAPCDLFACLSEVPPSTDCGGYGLALDAWGAGLPGINESAANDSFGDDGRPDGTMFLSFTSPDVWVPPAAGVYVAFMAEFYDMDGDGFLDFPTTDDHRSTFFVQREFTVGGCAAPAPYDMDRRSLKMVSGDVVVPCTPATDLSVYRDGIITPFHPVNVHEIVGRAALQTDLNPCKFDDIPTVDYGCNPWPTAATFGPLLGGTQDCITPSAGDMNYYNLYQRNDCTGASMFDEF